MLTLHVSPTCDRFCSYIENSSYYTCPMHPQVHAEAPGPCPICGMPLERVVPIAEDETSADLQDMTLRFKVSAALTLPLVLLGQVMEFRARHRTNAAIKLLLGLAPKTDRRRSALSGVWGSVESHACRYGDDVQLGLGHRKCLAIEKDQSKKLTPLPSGSSLLVIWQSAVLYFTGF